MKLHTVKRNEYYVIDIVSCVSEQQVADILNIPLNKYLDILINNRAFYLNNYWNYKYYFKTSEDAEKAITELTPYLVMAILTE